MENSTEVLPKKKKQNLKIELPYNPAISLPDTHPKRNKKTKTMIQKDICTSMSTMTLFTIAKIRKQAQCSSTGE